MHKLSFLPVSKLRVSQSELRNWTQLDRMIEFVADGGRFTHHAIAPYAPSGRRGQIIQLAKMNDGEFYILDGHHRILSIYRASREFLYPDEYEITRLTYRQFREINFDSQWFTPIDLKTEVRKGCFLSFKDRVRDIIIQSEHAAYEYIQDHRNLYSEMRVFSTVASMDKYLSLLSATAGKGFKVTGNTCVISPEKRISSSMIYRDKESLTN